MLLPSTSTSTYLVPTHDSRTYARAYQDVNLSIHLDFMLWYVHLDLHARWRVHFKSTSRSKMRHGPHHALTVFFFFGFDKTSGRTTYNRAVNDCSRLPHLHQKAA